MPAWNWDFPRSGPDGGWIYAKGRRERQQHCIMAIYLRGNHDVQCPIERGHGPGGLFCRQHGKKAEEAGWREDGLDGTS